MKNNPLTFVIALSTFAFTLSAQGHDPSEHMKDAEKPNCSAMKSMAPNEMDVKDPVMQAMVKQCTKDTHDDVDEKTEYSAHEPGERERHTKGEESPEHKH